MRISLFFVVHLSRFRIILVQLFVYGMKRIKFLGKMSANSNRMSVNLDALAQNLNYDEETWLVAPPEEANSSNVSGHVVEWLQVILLQKICFENLLCANLGYRWRLDRVG